MKSSTLRISSCYMAHDHSGPPPQGTRHLVKDSEEEKIDLIIGCDANALHTPWGSTEINLRGHLIVFVTVVSLVADKHRIKGISPCSYNYFVAEFEMVKNKRARVVNFLKNLLLYYLERMQVPSSVSEADVQDETTVTF